MPQEKVEMKIVVTSWPASSYILFDSGWAGPVLAISSDSGILAPFSLPGAWCSVGMKLSAFGQAPVGEIG